MPRKKTFIDRIHEIKSAPGKRITVSVPGCDGLYVRATNKGKSFTIVARRARDKKQVWRALPISEVSVDIDTLTQCGQPTGYVPTGGDCDDTDPLINPGENEPCNGTDNDCNGVVDDDFLGSGIVCGVGTCGNSFYKCFEGELECVDADTTPPDLTVPEPLSLECNTPGGVLLQDPLIQAWLAAAVGTDDCGVVPAALSARLQPLP